MNNIYKAPDSNLSRDDEAEQKPNIAWKIFFWLFTPLMLITIFGILFIENLNALDYIDVFIFLLTLLGLYGYAFSKKIATRAVWKVVFYTFIIWSVFYEAISPFILNIPQYGVAAEIDMWLLLNIIYLPLFISLYFYSFKSEHIWKQR